MESNNLVIQIYLKDGNVTLPNGSNLSIANLFVGDTIEITEIITSQNCVRGKLIRSDNEKLVASTNVTASQPTTTTTKTTTTTTTTQRSDNHPRTSLPEDTKKNGWLSVRPVSEISRERTFTTRPKEPGPSTNDSRSFFSSKSTTDIKLMASGVPSLKKETIRVWFKDGSFKTVAIIQDTTCEEVIERITKRIPSIGMNENASSHFVLSEVAPDGATRVLKSKDKLAAVQVAWRDKSLYKFILSLHPRTIRRISVQLKKGQDLSEVFNDHKADKSKPDSFLMDETDDGLEVLMRSLKEHAQKKQEENNKTTQQTAWVRSSTLEKPGSRLVLGHSGNDIPTETNDQPMDGSSPSESSPTSQAEQDVDEPDNEVDDFSEALQSPVGWFENEITSLSELVKSLPDNVLQNIQ